jgi:RimJ/RimL family protein N-acetyltransferase
MIRLLLPEDAAAFRDLTLRALKEHPSSFGRTYDEESRLTVDDFIMQLSFGNPSYGAFDGDVLVGMARLFRYHGRKRQHRAMLTSMYVVPEARGQGHAGVLVRSVLDYARAEDGIEEVVLAVTVGNRAARDLYISFGFQPYAVEPRYLKIDGEYYDIEWMTLRL